MKLTIFNEQPPNLAAIWALQDLWYPSGVYKVPETVILKRHWWQACQVIKSAPFQFSDAEQYKQTKASLFKKNQNSWRSLFNQEDVGTIFCPQ